jgi:4-amino-4-deoxy-L-arabinose transferase-like glycosyltransferase
MQNDNRSIDENRGGTYPFICALIIYLFVAASYCLILGSNLHYWDENGYLTLAGHLTKNFYSYNGTEPTAFQPPGYPFFLSLLSRLTSEVPILRFGNFLLFGLAITLSYLLMRKYQSNRAGLIMAIIAMAYPLFIYLGGTFFPQTLEIALLISVIFLIAFNDSSKWFLDLCAGIFFGLLILTVPLFIAYLPFFFLYPFIFKRRSKGFSIALFCFGCLLAIAPWTARNYTAFDRFIPVSTNGGINLLLGNSAETRPNSGVNMDLSKYSIGPGSHDEMDIDNNYRKKAVEWIILNPGDALKMYFLKTLNYFNYRNDLAITEESTRLRDLTSFLTFYPLLILAVVRVALCRRWPLNPLEKFLVLLLVVSPFIQAIFFTRVRFRLPFDFLMIFMAAGLLAHYTFALRGIDTKT